MSKKAEITAVQQVGGMYEITYNSGTVKKVLIHKCPQTALKWLEAHKDEAAADEPVEEVMEMTMEPEQTVVNEEISESITEQTMEPEMVVELVTEMSMETERPAEDEPAVEATAAAVPEVEAPQPIQLNYSETLTEDSGTAESAEPVNVSTEQSETIRKPLRKPDSNVQPGIWFTVPQILLLIGIRTLQTGVFMAWLAVQLVLSGIRLAEMVPGTIQRASAACTTVTSGMVRAYQSLTGAARTAAAYTAEIITDMGHGAVRYAHMVRVGAITLLSNIR